MLLKKIGISLIIFSLFLLLISFAFVPDYWPLGGLIYNLSTIDLVIKKGSVDISYGMKWGYHFQDIRIAIPYRHFFVIDLACICFGILMLLFKKENRRD